MSELEDRINQILGDPEQMKKITNIAQSLMGGEGAAPWASLRKTWAAAETASR